MNFIRAFDRRVLINIRIYTIKIIIFGIMGLGNETDEKISIKILDETNTFQNRIIREKWWASMYISARTEYLRDRKLIVSISHISAKSHLCNCLVKRIRKLIVRSNWRGKINNIRISVSGFEVKLAPLCNNGKTQCDCVSVAVVVAHFRWTFLSLIRFLHVHEYYHPTYCSHHRPKLILTITSSNKRITSCRMKTAIVID